MVRHRNRTTQRGSTVPQLEQAADAVKNQTCSVREAAKIFGIPRTSLQRFINQSASQTSTNGVGYEGVARAHMVFTNAQEKEIANHIKAFDDRFYGLTSEQCRKLAYSYAKSNVTIIPPSWNTNEIAGELYNYYMQILL